MKEIRCVLMIWKSSVQGKGEQQTNFEVSISLLAIRFPKLSHFKIVFPLHIVSVDHNTMLAVAACILHMYLSLLLIVWPL